MQQEQQLIEERTKINGLLRDTAFAADVAARQEAAYYLSQNQEPPIFFTGADTLQQKSFKEEKIAINLAGLYAVECGIGALAAQKGETPVYWLQQIVSGTIDTASALLLARFANATWKTGQPFRSLSRITRDNFIVATFLNKAEIQKDIDQVTAAASILLDSLKGVSTTSREPQLQKITQLLRDKNYAVEIARHQEAAYYKGQNKPVPPFLLDDEEKAMVEKSAREQKVATNIAGFYALECGVNYLSQTHNKLPSEILQSIIDNSIVPPDKQLLERFANATWKASQPFRGLDRITRDIMMPFDLLSVPEIEKDWVQVQSAAKVLLKAM